MSRAKNCIDKAVALGVSREKAESYRDHIVSGKPDEWEARALQLKERAKQQAEFAEKRAGINLARRVHAQQHIDRAPDRVTGLQSLLVGTNTAFEGSRLSAEAAILGYKSEFMSTFRRDLGDNDRLFASRSIEREWVRELGELNAKQGGQPGITGNKQALEIAQAVQKLQKLTREAQNRQGAEIGELSGRIARTEHDPGVLEQMGGEAWKRLVYQTADIPRTFGQRTAAEIDEALDEMYKRLRSGDFSDLEAAEDQFTAQSQNVAKKVSASRVLQFSSAENWYAYGKAASNSTVTERVMSDALKAARNAGLMSVLGTNPEDNFARILTSQRRRDMTAKERNALEGSEKQLTEWLKLMTGRSASQDIRRKGVALGVQNWLTVQRTAKLGFLPFAQIADLATVMSELRYQGVDVPSRLLGPLAGYFQGNGSQQREVAKLVGGGIEGWIAEINQRMDVTAHLDIADPQARGGPLTGALAATQNWMFKWSGATAMTNRARETGTYLMARYFGTKRGVAYASLNEAERRIMSAFEIGEPEWKALNAAEWTDVQGDVFMTPSIVNDIPQARLNEWKKTVGREKLGDDEARDILATRLWRYFSDRERYAVLDVGVQEKARLTGGMAPDDVVGIGYRLMAQFKSFLVAQVIRTWGREVHGQSTYGMVSGLVQFAAAATVLGTVAEMLRQIARNEDPLHSFREDPLKMLQKGVTRGGALGVLGDFTFGEFSRHGQRFTGYAMGPSGSIIDDVLTTYGQAKAGKPVGPSLMMLARNNIPLQNVWFGKAIFDHFVWAEIMDHVQPGYSARVSRRQRQNGIRPILGN